MKHGKRSDILEMIFPTARARILRLLFKRPKKARYVSELAQLSNLALSTTQEELASLLTAGLITSYSGGYRRFYRANQNHRLFSHLLALVHDADRLPPLDVSQLRRNRRTKPEKRIRGRKYRSRPLSSFHVRTGILAGTRSFG